MTTLLIDRLRQRCRVDSGDGTSELIAEAVAEIERLRLCVADLEQRLDVERSYSSSDWADDA
jgi:hypothetical protein